VFFFLLATTVRRGLAIRDVARAGRDSAPAS
jgi:hypothetical protein